MSCSIADLAVEQAAPAAWVLELPARRPLNSSFSLRFAHGERVADLVPLRSASGEPGVRIDPFAAAHGMGPVFDYLRLDGHIYGHFARYNLIYLLL